MTGGGDGMTGGESSGPIRVVLVEDHHGIRAQLVTLLQSGGIDVVAAAATATDGWEAIAATQPDVAVLDNHLPDGLGIDLCRRITLHHPAVAVLLHSADLTTQDEQQARHAGAAAVVLKTFSGADLIAAIHASASRPSGHHRAPTQS